MYPGLAYWALGWGLAYGGGGNPFCGASQFLSYHLPVDDYPIWLFDVSIPTSSRKGQCRWHCNKVKGKNESFFMRRLPLVLKNLEGFRFIIVIRLFKMPGLNHRSTE
jgi:hypothetical protein